MKNSFASMKYSLCYNSDDVKSLVSGHADNVPQVTSNSEDFISRIMLPTPYMELISKETFIIVFSSNMNQHETKTQITSFIRKVQNLIRNYFTK